MKNKFNVNQEKAVNIVDGPCLVLAGPGSGKTFVLTNRILNLIVNENISPENILVITFTRSAANEMKERFVRLINDEGIYIKNMPSFGTFHSVFFEILKKNFSFNSDSLVSEIDEKRILSRVLEKYKEIRIADDLLSNIIKDIKAYKLATERDVFYTPKSLSSRLFNLIFKDYEEALFNEKKLDFSDMISMCYKMLKEHGDVLSYYQEKYKYILLDEFQDINKPQYEIVRMLCKTKNLFVVGDDDQSIYKFRGSHPKVMSDFLNDYKKAKIVCLNENYRCAKQIVKFSKLVIDNNKDRFEKKLISARSDLGKIEIKAFVDAKQENEYIVDLINRYRCLGISLSEMAILYRTNLLSNSVIGTLNKNNISYKVKGLGNSIFEHFAVLDIISYLKLAIGSDDIKDMMRIANKPLRYISRDSIAYKKCDIDKVLKYYQNNDFVLKYITKFRHDLYTIKYNITPLAIRYIRVDVGYDKYLKEYAKEHGIDYEEIEEILDSFEEEAVGYNDIKDFLEYIESSKEKKDIGEIEDAISLMTFHLSKGLEFKVVFIIDANDGLIPHKKSIKENDIETERRLFYVALTRARDFLHVFFTSRRFGKNYKASRFIIEAIGGQNGKER